MQKCYDRHHELVDFCGNGYFPFYVDFFLRLSKAELLPALTLESHVRLSYTNQELVSISYLKHRGADFGHPVLVL